MSNFYNFLVSFQESCQNYVRVLVQPSPEKLLVCGTNSFRPMCHLYHINSTYVLETEKSGQAVCPYDPQHNSTAVFVGKCKISISVNLFLFILLSSNEKRDDIV